MADLSISPQVISQVPISSNDRQLQGKNIAVILVAMKHRDYVYKSVFDMGANIFFVDETLPTWAKPYAADFLYSATPCEPISTLKLLQTYQHTRRLSDSTFSFDGVISLDDYSLICASQVASAMHLPTSPPELLSMIKNKFTFRQHCANLPGVYNPKSLLITKEMFVSRSHDTDSSTILPQQSTYTSSAAQPVDIALSPSPLSSSSTPQSIHPSTLSLQTSYPANSPSQSLPNPSPPPSPSSAALHFSPPEILDTFTYPLVLKPIAGAGSHFVRRIDTREELVSFFFQFSQQVNSTGECDYWLPVAISPKTSTMPSPCSSSSQLSSLALENRPTAMNDDDDHVTDQEEVVQMITTTTTNAMGLDVDPSELALFMVEEMITGPEVDIDCVVDHGVIQFMSMTEGFPCQGPPGSFMESGGCHPPSLHQSLQDQLFTMARAVLNSLGPALSGVFHFEAMLTPNGPAPIELNLRLGGSEVLAMGMAVYHVNLGIQAFKIGANIPIEKLNDTTPYCQCISNNILAVDSGYVQSIGFLPQITQLDPAFIGGMYRSIVGDTLKAPPLGYQYCAWLVASGDNLNSAREHLDRITHGFFCHIQPFPRGDPHGFIPGTTKYYHDGSPRENALLLVQSGHSLVRIVQAIDTAAAATTVETDDATKTTLHQVSPPASTHIPSPMLSAASSTTTTNELPSLQQQSAASGTATTTTTETDCPFFSFISRQAAEQGMSNEELRALCREAQNQLQFASGHPHHSVMGNFSISNQPSASQ